MNKNTYRYSVKITKAYPADIRIFVSKLLPVLVKHYGFPQYDGEVEELDLFSWSWESMYIRDEEYILGRSGFPRVEFTRDVFGEYQFTDEWENSTLRLIDFCPPHISDMVSLEIECSESLLMTDKGAHQCTIELETSALKLYDEILSIINEILKDYTSAEIETIRKSLSQL